MMGNFNKLSDSFNENFKFNDVFLIVLIHLSLNKLGVLFLVIGVSICEIVRDFMVNGTFDLLYN